ncbi:MAG: hypothetical protein IPP67_06780 [Rhodospirillaceae bacterium]|nr:hypothetical protein [Rhodospirillaceae bacterium]
MMKKLTLILFIYLSYSLSIYADGIKTMRCTFNIPGISAGWDSNGEFKSTKSDFSTKPQDAVIIFDNINQDKMTARMVGNNGASDVYVLSTEKSLSFLEITSSGNPILTTLFLSASLSDHTFPAVMSRHISIIQPVISQFYGTCIDQSLH